MYTLVSLATGNALSRILILTGLALLIVSVVQLLRLLTASAVRATRSWGLAFRHMRRAAEARDAARRSRERIQHEECQYHEVLRRDREGP